MAGSDFNNDGIGDLVTGANGGPHLKVFAAGDAVRASFLAHDPGFTGGNFVG